MKILEKQLIEIPKIKSGTYGYNKSSFRKGERIILAMHYGSSNKFSLREGIVIDIIPYSNKISDPLAIKLRVLGKLEQKIQPINRIGQLVEANYIHKFYTYCINNAWKVYSQ